MKNIKIKFLLPNYNDLLNYGEIESDQQFQSKNKVTRISKYVHVFR